MSKTLVLAFLLLSLIAGCATSVRREGEFLLLACTFMCVLRITDGEGTLESQLRKKRAPDEAGSR